MNVTRTVKNRLAIMNIVIAITSLIGVAAVYELSNGVHLHELNFAHLKYSAEFEKRVEIVDFTQKNDMHELKTLIDNIRAQPIACMEQHNFINAMSAKMLGAYHTFELCEADLVIADRALTLLDGIQNGQTDRELVRAELAAIARKFHDHSYQFAPFVARIVDTLLVFTLFVMILKGGSALTISLLSSRSILRHFKLAEDMERQLHAKNSALGNSITKLVKQKQEIDIAKQMAEHNALHDPLTNLPNRRYLDRRTEELEHSERRIALLHIDIDHFKQINDTKGHDAGDFILVHVASTLQKLIRDNDFVARIGGDEFVVLAAIKEPGDSKSQIEKLSQRIVKVLGKPTSYNGEPCRLSVSVGAALRSEAREDMKSVFVNADIALYRAKMSGRNRFDIYDEELKKEVIERKSMADELILALERNEIVPFYQLQFHAKTLEISGMEALARWEHPVKGLIAPVQFLSVAEELGILGEIDQKIMKQAVADLKKLDKAGFNVPQVSVNISMQRLGDRNFLNDIKKLNLPAGRIVCELLESMCLDNAEDRLRETIDAVREYGIDLEIDDFGSGHASILGLLDARPKRFKIDRQVISDIHVSTSAFSVVKSIVAIGRALDMEVVAEGIETDRHVSEIQKTDCHYLQGFALAKPMAVEDLQEFLKERVLNSAA